jgi:hypothetical protein
MHVPSFFYYVELNMVVVSGILHSHRLLLLLALRLVEQLVTRHGGESRTFRDLISPRRGGELLSCLKTNHPKHL